MTFVTCEGPKSLNNTTSTVENQVWEVITRVAARLSILRVDDRIHNSRWTPVLGRLAGWASQ